MIVLVVNDRNLQTSGFGLVKVAVPVTSGLCFCAGDPRRHRFGRGDGAALVRRVLRAGRYLESQWPVIRGCFQ